MLYEITKIIISAVLIALISEISKRSTLLGAIFASIPLVSVLAIVWVYIDTHNPQIVASLASSILWLILPSLIFFISLPILLKFQIDFYLSLIGAIGFMVMGYFLMLFILHQCDIKL